MNVALGGTLYQDIAAQRTDAIKHDYFPTAGYARDHLAHPVTVASGSRLDALVGTAPLKVNSMHHQAVKDLAPGLVATAVAPDGLIEARRVHRGASSSSACSGTPSRSPSGTPACTGSSPGSWRPPPGSNFRSRKSTTGAGMADQILEQNPRIRLTAFSHGAGCACKLGPGELSQVLHHLPGVVDPRVLVDAATRDDAAVFRLSDDRALVATVDFFTPIVDDATQWGAIAAANALSDVYAMGGTPLFALNLVGWPREKLPFELLGDVLEGRLGGRGASGLRDRRRPLHRFARAALRHGRHGRGAPRPDAHQRRRLRRRRAGAHQAARHRHPHHRAQARRADRSRAWATRCAR